MLPTRYLLLILGIVTCLIAKGHAAPTAVNGTWSSWSSWTDCTTTCGNGEKLRSRECNDPAPAHGGLDCEGSNNETTPCLVKQCPINGMWSSWTSWDDCSKTCGNGQKLRMRQCNNPAPAHNGLDCEGDAVEFDECMIKHCPINGMWSSWSTWTPCSATCGNGARVRSRECNNPAPAYGGLDCEGNNGNVDTESCLIKHCPVHGGWSPWSSWIAECSATECNQAGLQLRKRACSNPRPNHGGRHCRGQYYGSRECINTAACPVDGQWGQWGDFGECSATCGNAIRQRYRECNNPEPKNGGTQCIASSGIAGVFPELCLNLPACPTTNGCTDDEDAECETSGDGSGAQPATTTHPCSFFESSYDYALCLDGNLIPPTPPPDVPGNEDESPDNPNPFEYSEYSLQYDTEPEAVDQGNGQDQDQGQDPAPNNNLFDYSLSSGLEQETQNPDENLDQNSAATTENPTQEPNDEEEYSLYSA